MFHGGTNFARWTGRWMTTTYDYDAMVREWGELSE
ncbi:beta-galactosidase [Tardisphaera miroshnichenkoae]